MELGLNKVLLIVCLLCLIVGRSAYGSAAILRSGLPGEDPALVDAVATTLRQAGIGVVELSADDLCQPSLPDSCCRDLLVLPNAAALPAKSTGAIDRFLREGGDIIALNAPLWQTTYIKVDGKWVTRDDFQRDQASTLPDNVLFDFKSTDISKWTRASDNDKEPSSIQVVDDAPAPGRKSIHVQIPHLTSWDTYNSRPIDKPFRKGETLTVFAAKGGPNTSQLIVEWSEKDGSRWIAVIPLYSEWRLYVLTPEDFKYWLSVPTRGGRGDVFKPENADRMSVGMAFTHIGTATGKQEYWMSTFGTAKMTPEYQEMLGAFSPPAMDILSPGYKFFDSTGVASLKVRDDQAIVGDMELPTASIIRSPHPRPTGGGFNKGRDWRFIPIVQAETASGEWRGTPVTMLANLAGPYKGGVWASFGIEDAGWYKSPAALSLIQQIARKMLDGRFMLDGATNCYTYFDGQEITLGVTVVSYDTYRPIQSRVTLTEAATGKIAVVKDSAVPPGRGTSSSSTMWKPTTWPKGGYIATAELIDNGKVIDKVRHEVNVWTPAKKKHFVTTKDGEFMLDGKRWRAHGVNYMPSSGVATEDGEFFEHWIGPRSYDPEVAQRDIDHMKDLGYNAVSIFVYYGMHEAQNLVDLLRRLDKAGMKANVSLRPGTPMDFYWPQIGEIIQDLRLKDNDTVFAYDLAWEPSFGHQRDRAIWDGDWEKWIIERYGSIASAEKDWGFPVPRDENGKITNPTPEQVDTDGDWRLMVAAYRRFLDTLLYKKYGEARRLVRTVDPNHLVSFRMSEAGNPIYHWEGRIPYDFPYLAAAVDFLAPEAYGRIGNNWEKVAPAWFEREYARWAAPMKPMTWAEQGVHVWDYSRMEESPEKLKFQADFYDLWYQMLIKSCANGLFSWYYPGGFRVGENSDYGVINPDGSDRPVSEVIRRYADQFINGPSAKPIDYWITIDRDAHTDGESGIYEQVRREFWAAIDKGFVPGLRTEGTGTNSSNCPFVAVGNVPCTGSNPPKYLDAAFDLVEVKDSTGKWVEVHNGDTIKVKPGKPVKARITFTNLGEATLLSGKGDGAVFISGTSDQIPVRAGIGKDVRHLESAVVETTLYDDVKRPIEGGLSFWVDKYHWFGEEFTIRLEPE